MNEGSIRSRTKRGVTESTGDLQDMAPEGERAKKKQRTVQQTTKTLAEPSDVWKGRTSETVAAPVPDHPARQQPSQAIAKALSVGFLDPVWNISLDVLRNQNFDKGLPYLIAYIDSTLTGLAPTSPAFRGNPVGAPKLCDGTLAALMVCRPRNRLVASLTPSRQSQVKAFCGQNIQFYLLQKGTEKVQFLCTGETAASRWRDDTALNSLLSSNHLNMQDEGDVILAYHISAMLFTGQRLQQDKDWAAAVHQAARDAGHVGTLVAAGISCIFEDQTELFGALLSLGLDPEGEDESGESIRGYVNDNGSTSIQRILEHHLKTIKQ